MAKANYKYEKRKRELDKQRKKAEKQKQKQLKKNTEFVDANETTPTSEDTQETPPNQPSEN